MKKYRRTLATLALLMLLNGCAANAQTIETEPPTTTATAPVERTPTEESGPPPTEETNPVRESVEETEEASVTEPTAPKVTEPKEPERKPERNDTPANQPTEETEPPATTPPETEPPTTEPPATEPEETLPPETVPEEMEPPETEPPATELEGTEPPTTAPAETVPPETEPEQTEPPATEAPEETEPTEPEVMEYSYAFKREVASYAAMYLNQYRGASCTVLPGMSQVAQYRASQLTWNFAHSTADKRAALAAFEYGEWIDATVAGLDESDSYYEAHTREAICRYFHGDSPEELGKAIADMIRNSSSHWCYVGDTTYSYMGVGVEYRDGWYACVMVGEVNYG